MRAGAGCARATPVFGPATVRYPAGRVPVACICRPLSASYSVSVRGRSGGRGNRPGVVARIDGHWFVGPNEGLFALLSRRATSVECWQLPHSDSASPSFHGRDVFAPAAARLARGLGPPGEVVDAAALEQAGWLDDLPRIVYIDRYGNAMTGLRASSVPGDAVLTVNGHALNRARTFTDVGVGEAFWYENANGLVEFAVNRGRADAVLSLAIGDAISL